MGSIVEDEQQKNLEKIAVFGNWLNYNHVNLGTVMTRN